ncbi:MAG: hypothetical protein IH598_08965 [Bacteroidales bacterium]|nr:hypothetical protein [Bacteroidales bacterium]
MKLLLIEWEKIRNYRAFWLMVALYLFVLISAVIGLPAFFNYMTDKTNASVVTKLFTRLLLSFPDVWQNIAFFAGLRAFIKVVLAILVVILISNEFSFLTIRSNIINGLSRKHFLLAKIELVFMLSLLSTLVLFLSGLYLGFVNTPTITFSQLFSRIYFLPAYFVELFTYLTFAMMIRILIRKTGFAIIALLFYIMVEPIIQYYTPDQFDKFLPLNAMNHLVWSVNTSSVSIKTPEINFTLQESIALTDLAVCLAYAVFFTGIIWFYLKRKDL